MSTKKRLSTDYTGEAESPFLDQEFFVGEPGKEWEPRVAALAAESPFVGAFKAFEEKQNYTIAPEFYEEDTKEPEPEGFHEKEHEYEGDSRGEHPFLHPIGEGSGEVTDDLTAEAFDSQEGLDELKGPEESEAEELREELEEDELVSRPDQGEEGFLELGKDEELKVLSGGALSVRPKAWRAIRAARRNRYHAKKLGWKQHVGAILGLLNTERGKVPRSFIEAVADWQKNRGLTADGVIGEKTWSAMKKSISIATVSGELVLEHQVGSKPKRLSAGAVGDAFLEYQQSVSIPDKVIDLLHSASSFRLIVNSMDKKYVAITTLAKSGEPDDMNDAGFLTKGKFAGRRVLEIVSMISRNAFFAARTVDNLDHLDRIQLAEPSPDPNSDLAFKERALHRNWISRILCLLAQADNEVRAKRKRADPIAKRIRTRVTEQRIIRLTVDNVLKDIDRSNKGVNVGTLFEDFSVQPFVEIAYYPDDLIALDSPLMLTNLEHCALLELLEDARRAEKLDDSSLEEQKKLIDAIPLSTDVTELARTLGAPWPTVIDDTGKERIIPTDFGAYYHARRIFDRRWRRLNPQGKDWKRDLDMKDMRLEHAEVFSDAATYMLHTP